MHKWELVRLPSFEADLEQYQIDEAKLNKWLEDFEKAPNRIKNAHPLKGVLKPLWSAHFNEKKTYIVIYLLCDGNEASCFSRYKLSQFSYIPFEIITEHKCNKDSRKVLLCRCDIHDYRRI